MSECEIFLSELLTGWESLRVCNKVIENVRDVQIDVTKLHKLSKKELEKGNWISKVVREEDRARKNRILFLSQIQSKYLVVSQFIPNIKLKKAIFL